MKITIMQIQNTIYRFIEKQLLKENTVIAAYEVTPHRIIASEWSTDNACGMLSPTPYKSTSTPASVSRILLGLP